VKESFVGKILQYMKRVLLVIKALKTQYIALPTRQDEAPAIFKRWLHIDIVFFT
jgi:hypothetical protein